MPNSLHAGDRNPYLRANSLPELLSWEDVDFVRCAFVTVLGRRPDAAGEAYYSDRIRRGHSKLELLEQLRNSPEARRHDPGIAGFDRTLRRARWERKRVIGSLVRLFTKGEADNQITRMHRSILNELAIIKQRAGLGPQVTYGTAGSLRDEGPRETEDSRQSKLATSRALTPLSLKSFEILIGATSR